MLNVMVSQITSVTIVYSIVYSDADQRKLQSYASLAFVRGIHRQITGEFTEQRASNMENASIWWHHHYFDPAEHVATMNNGHVNVLGPLLLTWINFNPSMDK